MYQDWLHNLLGIPVTWKYCTSLKSQWEFQDGSGREVTKRGSSECGHAAAQLAVHTCKQPSCVCVWLVQMSNYFLTQDPRQISWKATVLMCAKNHVKGCLWAQHESWIQTTPVFSNSTVIQLASTRLAGSIFSVSAHSGLVSAVLPWLQVLRPAPLLCLFSKLGTPVLEPPRERGLTRHCLQLNAKVFSYFQPRSLLLLNIPPGYTLWASDWDSFSTSPFHPLPSPAQTLFFPLVSATAVYSVGPAYNCGGYSLSFHSSFFSTSS